MMNALSAAHLQLLQHFGLTPRAFLGGGSESTVYLLDETRILRIYFPKSDVRYIQARQAFYALLQEKQPAFVFPTIFEFSQFEDLPYSIEARILGKSFGDVLPILSGAERKQALNSYLETALSIPQVTFPERPYGELALPMDTLACETWADYLQQRIARRLITTYADLDEDVPNLSDKLHRFYAQCAQRSDPAIKALVHGDYYPPNVFINAGLRVFAIGDFGYSTLAGHPEIDIASTLLFLEVTTGATAADRDYLRQRLVELGQPISDKTLAFYKTYYAYYFSNCKADDPDTYWWCVNTLTGC